MKKNLTLSQLRRSRFLNQFHIPKNKVKELIDEVYNESTLAVPGSYNRAMLTASKDFDPSKALDIAKGCIDLYKGGKREEAETYIFTMKIAYEVKGSDYEKCLSELYIKMGYLTAKSFIEYCKGK